MPDINGVAVAQAKFVGGRRCSEGMREIAAIEMGSPRAMAARGGDMVQIFRARLFAPLPNSRGRFRDDGMEPCHGDQ